MSAVDFGDTDWDQFLKAQNKTGIQIGNWDSAKPTPGSDAATQGWFNAGSPGSLTALINSKNPDADPGKAYVQFGNTGGYQDRNDGSGAGDVTIGPGRSIRPADYVDMYNKAVAQYGKAGVDEWEARNPFDINRVGEAFTSNGESDGASGGNAWDAINNKNKPGGGQSWSGNWFDDPANSQLESVIKNQLNQLTNPGANDPQSQLMSFLMKRFQELSTSNGYSPDELALLNTQGLEPIEQLRKASQSRELERTARAGYMPTSGLTRLNQQTNDLDYDRMRTAASRDLAVQNVNERTNRLNQATQLGQLALNTQRGTNTNQLQLSTLLQQMPRQAMLDAMSVFGQSGSPDVLAGIVSQIAAQNNQNNYLNQQQSYGFYESMITAALRAAGLA